MLPIYETRQRAEGRIELTINRMAHEYPFHAKILERFKIVERREVGTMAVTASANDVLLLHNPDFVLGFPADQLTGVLLHEVHHVLFGHIFIDPGGYSDKWALTAAEEVTVNEFINELLPDWVIKLDLFPELPPMESTEERYARLKKRVDRIPISAPMEILEKIARGREKADQVFGSQRKTADIDPEKAQGTLDDHSVWQEASGDRERAQALVEEIIHDTIAEVDRQHVPEYLRQVVRDCGVGDTPGEACEELVGDGDGCLDWRRLLRRYVG